VFCLSLIEFIDVSFESGNDKILDHISFIAEEGDYISIVGPSGSGKTTLLKLCNHLISPTYGTILYNNKDLNEYEPTELRKKIIYCSQIPCLFPDTVMDNIKFPFQIRGLKTDMEKISKIFSMFKMSTDYLSKRVNVLSGGEKQMIALIRALLFKPEILLLDEVTSALDPENTKIVENIIVSLSKENTAIFWVTHSPEQSRKFANKLLYIEAGKIKSLEVLK